MLLRATSKPPCVQLARARHGRFAQWRRRAPATFALLVGLGASSLASGGSPADPSATAPRAEAVQRIWSPGVRDGEHVGRWQREFERRQALAKATGSSPRAVLALVGLLGQLEGEIDRDTLVAFLLGLENDKRRDAEVRSVAAYTRARLLEDSGQKDAALRVFEKQGYLTRFMLVGPFDRNKDESIDDPLGPELQAFDPGQSFEGKLPSEAMAWHLHSPRDALSGAYVSLDEFLFPNVEVIGYASTFIKVPATKGSKKQRVMLTVGSGGPYRVFVDGRLAGGNDALRSPDPLQDTHVVELAPGWHRVLVKLAADEGVWGLYLRASDTAGRPLDGLVHQARPPKDGLSAAAGAGAGAVDPKRPWPAIKGSFGLRARLEAGAKGRGKAKARAKLDLAEFYRWVRPFDADEPTDLSVAQAAEAELKDVRSAMLVASLSRDPNDTRDALERAIRRARKEVEGRGPKADAAASARLGELLFELYWRYQALGLDARARETLREARSFAPDDAMIELTAVDELSDDGFALAALAWVEDIRRRYPDSATVTRTYAGRLMDLGRVKEGLALLEKLEDAGLADGSVAHARIRAHLALGEVDKARAIGQRLVKAAPGRPRVYAELAELYEAEGNYPAAVEAVSAAIELAPQDAALHRRKGELLARQGERDPSILAFRRSLELQPQQPDIQDLLASYDTSSDADVFALHGLDLEAEVQALAKRGEPKNWAGKEAGVVHHRIAQRVFDNGLGERLDHRIIKVLDDRGVRSQAVQAFTFDPAESYVEVRRARVRRADGRIEELGETSAYSLAAAGYRMYYDQRQLRVSFQGLRVGDVVEVAFVRRDVAARNMFDDYYGDLVPLADSVPIAKFDYVLDAPDDLDLFFNQSVNKAELPAEASAAQGGKQAKYVRYTLERRGVAAIKPEGNMPGWTEVLEYLHVSTYGDWNSVAKWYWGLVEEQLVVGPEIKQGVREALATVAPGAPERDKVDAIYRHVIRSTRYVGLEFGIHGYKPYKTTDIYDRRFGDCKDKASLLKVMLAEIGVDSHLVLVRTRDQGAIGKTPASLSAFNHAIVYVPKYDLYLDGTAEWSGANELPSGDQGASVLIVKDGKGGEFTRIPISAPGDNTTRYTERVELDDDGSAKVQHEMELVGAGAASWRAGYQSPDEQKERLTKMMGQQLPGTVVRQASFAAIDDPLAPVQLTQTLEVPAWSRKAGAAAPWRFRVNGRESSLVRRFAPLAKREHDLVLTVPMIETREMEYLLPRQHDFSQLPSPKSLESKHGRFGLTVEPTRTGAKVKTRFELRTYRIPAADYKEFREFLRQVDAAMEQAFEFQEAQ